MRKMKNIKDKLIFLKSKIKFLGLSISIKYRNPELKSVCDDVNTIMEFKPDYVVKLQGGLGNQMFQYAFSKALKGKVLFDLSEFNVYRLRQYALDKFNLNIKTVKNHIMQKFLLNHGVLEPKESIYDEQILKLEPPVYYSGYFQSIKYIQNYREELMKEFVPNVKYTKEYKKVEDEITNSNSVLLNFRVAKDYKNLGWSLCYNYQKEAIDYIAKNVKNPIFYVFADDIDEVKKTFETNYELRFVDIEKNNPDKMYLDLELMKKCKHAILSTSSFAFWAGWLNNNPDAIIIVPDPWLKTAPEIAPDNWHKIKV